MSRPTRNLQSGVYWISSGTARPPREFSQDQVFEMAGYDERLSPTLARKMRLLFRSTGVARRALWLNDRDFSASNDPNDFHRRYVTGVAEIAPRAARQALARAGITGADLDDLIFVSCTGFTVPGYSIELARALGVSGQAQTTSLLGMGCSAFVPALGRAYQSISSGQSRRALVVAAEICSSTYWLADDLESAVGNALFGDGSAAVLLSCDLGDVNRAMERGLGVGRIREFATERDDRFVEDMGFTVQDGRLRVRLAREIPDRVEPLLAKMADRLKLTGSEWIAIHPGGRKILDRTLESLGKNWQNAIEHSRSVLRDYGNMSSPTIVFVAEHIPHQAEQCGALITMGPGLSVEAVRLEWINGSAPALESTR